MTITPRDGEPVTYTSYDELERDFVSGKVRGSGWVVPVFVLGRIRVRTWYPRGEEWRVDKEIWRCC